MGGEHAAGPQAQEQDRVRHLPRGLCSELAKIQATRCDERAMPTVGQLYEARYLPWLERKYEGSESNTRKPNERDGGLALQATLLFPFPGMAHDCRSNLPTCLLKSWTPEQLDYMHDIDWWRAIISQTEGVEFVDMHAMECTAEAWADWLACDNPYAQGDRAAIAAGALGYLNTIAITLRKL